LPVPTSKTLSRIVLATLAGWLVAPRLAHAGGFYIPEIGPRAVATAGAQVAAVDDTTAIFHNPAALGGQPGTQVQAAGSMFFGNVEYFRRPIDLPSGERLRFDPVRNTNRIGGAPYLGIASDVTVKGLAIGLGVYAPFGAHIAYPEGGAQRHVVQEVEFRTIFVTPTIAYEILEQFSIGVGLSYVYADIAIDQANALPYLTGDPEAFPDPDPMIEGKTQLRGRDPGSFSASIGLRWRHPSDRVALGLSLMTPTRLRFTGDAKATNPFITPLLDPETGDELQPGGVREDGFALDYPLPLIVRAGIMVRPHERVALMADFNWQRWQTFDQLVVQFENHHELTMTPGAYLYDVVIDQKWRNTMSLRLGMDAMPARRIPLHLRAGVMADQSPVADRYFDVLAPDSDKVGVSIGLGYTFALGRRVKLDADIGFMHLFFKQRSIGPETAGADFVGNDDDGYNTNDSMDNGQVEERPGSAKTILNKPSPSFYYGVTRVFFDILGVGVALRV
jgi:long-chain fatty acid transport protein